LQEKAEPAAASVGTRSAGPAAVFACVAAIGTALDKIAAPLALINQRLV
jgi:hypothetical protein